MRHGTAPTWLVATLAGSLTIGCQTTSGPSGYPDDPLLTTKKPVKGRADSARPVQVAHAEPVVPAFPPTGIAQTKPPTPPTVNGREVVAQPTRGRKAPVEATPAVRARNSGH
jgi:hypothetical protein